MIVEQAKKRNWSLFGYGGHHLGHKLRLPDPLKQTQDIGKFEDGIFFFKATYFHIVHYTFKGASVLTDYPNQKKKHNNNNKN